MVLCELSSSVYLNWTLKYLKNAEGIMVWEKTLDREVVVSNPSSAYKIDVILHIIFCKIALLKKAANKFKRDREGSLNEKLSTISSLVTTKYIKVTWVTVSYSLNAICHSINCYPQKNWMPLH